MYFSIFLGRLEPVFGGLKLIFRCIWYLRTRQYQIRPYLGLKGGPTVGPALGMKLLNDFSVFYYDFLLEVLVKNTRL